MQITNNIQHQISTNNTSNNVYMPASMSRISSSSTVSTPTDNIPKNNNSPTVSATAKNK